MLTIDGSEGEGGGQIVRSSMALAVITGRPVLLENIRAGRPKPGLARQHLTSVRAAAEICDGQLVGDEIGSNSLTFHPGTARGGRYQFSVGTAGSAMLVLQTVLPALLTTNERSTLILEGGTHNPWAPPFDFLQRAFLPLVNRMGPRVTMRLERHGFFPAGGGRVVVEIEPSSTLTGFDLLERGRVERRQLTAQVSNLPFEIAQREVKRGLKKLNWRQDEGQALSVESNGPGNLVTAEIECENVTEVISAFGKQGLRAEKVADQVARDANGWLNAEVPIGEYLADQLLLPLGLSAAQDATCGVQRGGKFRTVELSQHSTTHIRILQEFLQINIATEASNGFVVVQTQAKANCKNSVS